MIFREQPQVIIVAKLKVISVVRHDNRIGTAGRLSRTALGTISTRLELLQSNQLSVFPSLSEVMPVHISVNAMHTFLVATYRRVCSRNYLTSVPASEALP